MPPAHNHLIERLPRRERTLLLASCEPVELLLSETLCEAGAVTRHVYFPVASFVSLVARVPEHPGLEMGMVGREGMVGMEVVLGVATSPLHALVQGGGASWRVGVAAFRRTLAQSPALQRELNLYLYVLMAQTVSSGVCLRFHRIAPRLARWLLMSQDRAGSAQFHVTHEFLALMLGVRRVGVTEAAGDLQRRGFITYQRGELTVLNRRGLEAAACGCYAADRAVYATYLRQSR